MPFAVINALDRHRSRIQSERVTTQADDHREESVPDLERGSPRDENEDDNSLVSVENNVTPERQNSTTIHNNSNNNTGETDVENGESLPSTFTTNRVTLAGLEEEREIFRRRSSLCLMFSIFFLFRLWIEAINEGDWGLLMICLVGTSWTARWINHNREREEELDRMIANYNERQNNRSEPMDMTMLSFQAQLALAIMESQRQMMQGGGYGHSSEGHGAGVSDAAKEKWVRFEYSDQQAAKSSGAYGSVKTVDDCEAPHCSICLGEYEGGEACVKLPCNHIYHDECISSWTLNHTKCPLCNLELENTVSRSEEASPTPVSGTAVIV